MDEHKFWDMIYLTFLIGVSDMFLKMITADDRQEFRSSENGRHCKVDEISDEFISLSYIYYANIDDFPGFWGDVPRKHYVKPSNKFDKTDLNNSSISKRNEDFRENLTEQNISDIASTVTPPRFTIRDKQLLLKWLKENRGKVQFKKFKNNAASTKPILLSQNILSYLFPIFQLFYLML